MRGKDGAKNIGETKEQSVCVETKEQRICVERKEQRNRKKDSSDNSNYEAAKRVLELLPELQTRSSYSSEG